MPWGVEMNEEIINFVDKVKKFPGILAIALFGSYARGEVTKTSDIDIVVVYSKKRDELIKKINELASERMQIVHVSLDELSENATLSGALSGEGLLLYGRPVNINTNKIGLKPKLLITYDTSTMSKLDRVKLNRALYGGKSTSVYKGKKYVSKYEGIVAQEGIENIGKATLLIDRGKESLVLGVLKTHKAIWKEIAVWTY
jgi:predicted nucleotidyltransferase